MSDVIYRPLIEDMTWSYSRITCFEQCKYRWFLKYIHGEKEEPQFYASYGKFMHKLIEMFYKGEISKAEMKTRFLIDFQKEVVGRRPSEKIVSGFIEKGVKYLDTFTEFPMNMVDVEMEVSYKIGDYQFIGFIDYVGERDGKYYIVDNKSRDLKPRSKRSKPTKKDEELDEMLKQLYLYSAAIKEKYGEFPDGLCFNCFKTGTFIEEPFILDKYYETLSWAECMIETIADEERFRPSVEFFNCAYLCGVSDDCEYWQNR